MIEKWITSYLARRRFKKWLKTPIGEAITDNNRDYFYGDTLLASFSDEAKKKHIMNFVHQVASLDGEDNPFVAMRELLVGYVDYFTSFKVLCMSPEDKAESDYADCPQISAELSQHIVQCVAHNEELQNLAAKHEDVSPVDWINFCRARQLIGLYYLSGIALIRIDIGDLTKEKNTWYKEYVKSMLILAEHNVRQEIGLPSLLDDPGDEYKLMALSISVGSGSDDPFQEVEETWAEES